MNTSLGIHHITAITGNPQKNLDFYEGFLGQKLVKRTVNFDDPRSYHFYFADATGSPGTLLTFFYFGNIPAGFRGVGEVGRIAYTISPASQQFWMERALEWNIATKVSINVFKESVLSLQDPDGMQIDLVSGIVSGKVDAWKDGPVPLVHALQGFRSASLTVTSVEEIEPTLVTLGFARILQSGQHVRFSTSGTLATILDCIELPDAPRARQGLGSVHHIAFRAESDEVELLIRQKIENAGLQPTNVIDRKYFHSVYFQTPSNILFEIATDSPGMTVDESLDSLGEKLVLPDQFEERRTEIERNLVPITLPRHQP